MVGLVRNWINIDGSGENSCTHMTMDRRMNLTIKFQFGNTSTGAKNKLQSRNRLYSAANAKKQITGAKIYIE